MKQLLLIIGLLAAIVGRVQGNTSFKINDGWLEKYGSKGLKVGDKMPNIPLGKVVNNYTGKTHFADFKGKLVILDFWSTFCTSCIKEFPLMEALQHEFGDKIQIFLVNPWETEGQIKSRLKKIRLPNLPSIVADTIYGNSQEALMSYPLFKLFPTRTTGQYVWIDTNGVIKVRGGALNNYSKKVRDVLAGKDVFVMNSSATVPAMYADKNATYYKQLGSLVKTPLVFGSFITPYNNELVGFTNELIDSSSRSRIRYFINANLLDLYMKSLSKRLSSSNIIYSPIVAWADLLIFPERFDTLEFTSEFPIEINNRHLTDQEFISSKYCYEQIVPMNLSEEAQDKYMLDDLNRYFGQNKQIIGEVETKKIRCYVLVRTSERDLLSSKGFDFSKDTVINKKGQKNIKIQSWSLGNVLQYMIDDSKILHDLLLQNKITGKSFLIINETGWNNDKKVDMLFPMNGLSSIAALKQALSTYGLDIVESEREINFLVFKQIE